MQSSDLLLRTAFDRPDDHSPGAILQRAIAVIEAAGIETCILHGYEGLPVHVPSDVDCVVSAEPDDVIALLHSKANTIGAQIVRRRGGYIVLAAPQSDGLPVFVTLDLSRHCTVDDLLLYTRDEILASRRRFGTFWVPAAPIAFAAYLARCTYKGRLDDARIQYLEGLYKEDPSAVVPQLRKLWLGKSSEILAAAIAGSRWDVIRASGKASRRQLIVSCLWRHPVVFLRGRLESSTRRLASLLRPEGVAAVMLGPDGAGKSSVIEALTLLLEPAFSRREVRGFAPALMRLLGRRPSSTSDPHGRPPRSVATSLARAGYWMVFSLWNHLGLRLAKARSTLVLYDRHLCDVLIDSRRYRYGGPRWALRLAAWLMPRPDLILMLDAPAAVIQARKQEVPLAETTRQLELYREFMASLCNGYIIDATLSPTQVTAEIAWIILGAQAAREQKRLLAGRTRLSA